MSVLYEYVVVLGGANEAQEPYTTHDVELVLQGTDNLEGYTINRGYGWSKEWGTEAAWRIHVWAPNVAIPLEVARKLREHFKQDSVGLIRAYGEVHFV